MLSEWKDDDGGKQRTDGSTAVASHLEDGLCQTLLASRSHLRHTRGCGVEDGRAQSHDAHSQENQEVVLGEGEQHQAYQREAHANGKSVWSRMLVGVESREGLEDGGSHLENQRDDADLCKRESVFILDDRVDGRDDRLNHVVEEVRDAADDEHRIDRSFRHGRSSLDFVSNCL